MTSTSQNNSSKPQRRSLIALTLATTLLAACAPELPTVAEPADNVSIPSLTTTLGTEIAATTGTVLDAGDAKKDSKLLEERLTGPALKLRNAEYKIATAQKEDKSITELPAQMQSFFMTTTNSWPRTMFSVSQRPQNLQPERLMVYTQADARSDYKLWAYLALFPSISVPTFPVAEVGTDEITAADESLQSAPGKVLDDYVALLTDSKAENKAKFDVEKDKFFSELAERRKYLREAAKQIEGTYKETFAVGDEWHALRTLDGGAVVVGTIETSATLKGEKGAVISPSAIEKAFLAKDAKVKNQLTVNRTAVVAIYIPAKDNTEAKPTAIGRTMITTGASVPK